MEFYKDGDLFRPGVLCYNGEAHLMALFPWSLGRSAKVQVNEGISLFPNVYADESNLYAWPNPTANIALADCLFTQRHLYLNSITC